MNWELASRCEFEMRRAKERKDWYRVYQINNALRFLLRCGCRVTRIDVDKFPRHP